MGTWTPRQRATVVWGGVLLWSMMEVLGRTFFLLYELNFSIEGPGPWALASLVLLSAALYPLGLARHWPHQRMLLGVLAAVMPVLLALSLAPRAELALVGALLWHLAATPMVFAMASALRRRTATSVALALAARLATLAWTGDVPLAATFIGSVVLMLVGIGWSAMWIQISGEVSGGTRRLPNPAPLWAFLYAALALFATPAVAARWQGVDAWSLQAAALLGAVAGAATILRGAWAGTTRAWAAAGVLAASAAWMLWMPLPQLGVFAGTWSLLAGLDAAMDRPRHGNMMRHAWTTLAVQAALVMLVFLHLVAVNWPFVAGAEVLAGHADLLLWALAATVAAAVLRRQDWGAPA